MHSRLPVFIPVLIAILVAGRSIAVAEQAKRPNVLLIMTDDQGWGDTGYNGHPNLKTPNLDEMAKSGLRLDRFYAAHSNCSPTRGSVLTGRHPNRFGCFSHGYPIRPEEVTVAETLRAAGYATGHFGKWHLNGVRGPGMPIAADDPLSPGKNGFDEWVSVSNFYDLDPAMARNGVPEQFKGDSSDIATDEALKFIRRQAGQGREFLTVVWFGSPHSPHRALAADKAAYSAFPATEQAYYGELTAVDRSVGRLRQELRELQIAENTIVWFCSDNGGDAGPNSTGHLRGAKGTLWEGGVRVPGIVEWPARMATPSISDWPSSTVDIFPTVLAAAGLKAEGSRPVLDGVSLLPLFDRKMETRGRPIPFWDHTREFGHAALLDWPYKLHTNPTAGRGKKAAARETLPAVLLYDVSKDPNEMIDLAAQEPARVARMTSALESWKASVEKSLAGADYRGSLMESAPTKREKSTKN
jgi:arylsulfatase A-like enzyme